MEDTTHSIARIRSLVSHIAPSDSLVAITPMIEETEEEKIENIRESIDQELKYINDINKKCNDLAAIEGTKKEDIVFNIEDTRELTVQKFKLLNEQLNKLSIDTSTVSNNGMKIHQYLLKN